VRAALADNGAFPSEGQQGVTQGVSIGSDDRRKQSLNVKPARKCSPLFPLKYRLTERHVQMLAELARQRALTSDQLTILFFGSKRRCQAALAYLKQLVLIRHVIYLPQPLAGAGPRAYILTAEGARVAAQITGINRKVLGLRAARTGRSFLHINHTLAINDFYVQLLTTTRSASGRLIWMGQDQALAAYARNGKPTLAEVHPYWGTVGKTRTRVQKLQMMSKMKVIEPNLPLLPFEYALRQVEPQVT
jgi:protein involved in plasmid replication-relaxation